MCAIQRRSVVGRECLPAANDDVGKVLPTCGLRMLVGGDVGTIVPICKALAVGRQYLAAETRSQAWLK